MLFSYNRNLPVITKIKAPKINDMKIKSPTLLFFIFLSIPLFSQEIVESKGIDSLYSNVSYLDFVKKSFVNHEIASRIDSLWMEELTNLDLYNDISNDIENINLDETVDYELPTELLKSRLEAMNAKSPFKIEYNQNLENIIKSFLKNRKRSFEKIMAISDYYFPMFEETFAKENVPLEIKYLAVVESALNPKAVSRVGAAGLWQFMYQTGKQFNLNVDSYVDERHDPIKATTAAAKYLSDMYGIFGDWELVLASYNSGPGNVTKAIRRSGGKQNYWKIRENLPKETQAYVPAFLATMYLYEYQNEHGIVPDKTIVQRFATDTVMIKKQISFKQISDLLDIPVTQLQLLNPSYKLSVIPYYEDKNHYLRLPIEKIAVFTSNEDKIYDYVQHQADLKEKPFENSKVIVKNDDAVYATKLVYKTKYYKIKSGDNLGSIANKFGVTVTNIKKWNHLKSNYISAGKKLKIITPESIVKKTENISEEKITSAPDKNIAYKVQKGDNLGYIAKKFGITIADLKNWNHLNNSKLSIGQILLVAKKEIAVSEKKVKINNSFNKSSQREEISYYVQKGDSLYTIAKKYPGVSATDIKKWNNMETDRIKPGMKLKIRS